jgi:hypothetical protein
MRGSPTKGRDLGTGLAQAHEVQDHEGPVDEDRRGRQQHGQPGRARQAARSFVVIGGAHEAPVSPAAMAAQPRLTLRPLFPRVEAFPCAQAAQRVARWRWGEG